MLAIVSALRQSHRYVRALAMADPSNTRLETLYRDLTAALASVTAPAACPLPPVALHLN